MFPFRPHNTSSDWCQSDNFAQDSSTSCSSWIFEDTLIKTTAVEDFEMICDHKQRKSLTQTFYMVGMLIGRIIIYI